MKYKFIFILFFTLNLFSQDKKILVEYEVKVFEEENLFSDNSALKSLLNNAIKYSNSLSFSLLINNDKSKFFCNQNLINDSNGYSEKHIFPFIGYIGKVYTSSNYILKQHQIISENFYTKDSLKDNWQITSQTKKIDGYLCYMAKNTYVVKNGEKQFNHKVIAWFCPDLPFAFGPNGYGNLPGLILELQVRNYLYGATKIDINSSLSFNEEDDLKNIKIITEEELNKKLDEFNNFDGN